ncbi:hypothetical protein E2320_000920 [Naja naja]|nr:hypothetical protein E2320_000920 [Naja naja]
MVLTLIFIWTKGSKDTSISMSKPYVPPSGYLPVFKPALPYHHLLPDGLQPGTSVYVQGVVSQHAKRFWVNFSCGQHEGANIPFHFNPHFDGNDKIALNTFQDSKWDTEEHHEMPFQNGKHFEIIFIVNNEEYQILVNKNPFFSYKHRMPPQCVQVVSLDGDLEIQSLAVIERPKKGNIMLMDSVIFHPAVPFKEEIVGGLKPNLLIHCDQYRFIVYANDEYFFSYAHRYIHFPQIKILEIIGDVSLSYVQY